MNPSILINGIRVELQPLSTSIDDLIDVDELNDRLSFKIPPMEWLEMQLQELDADTIRQLRNELCEQEGLPIKRTLFERIRSFILHK